MAVREFSISHSLSIIIIIIIESETFSSFLHHHSLIVCLLYSSLFLYTSLFFSCLVGASRSLQLTGIPPPMLQWYKDGVMIDGSYVVGKNGTVWNDLTIYKLSPRDLLDKYVCQAGNFNSSSNSPIMAHVIIDINCKSLHNIYFNFILLYIY